MEICNCYMSCVRPTRFGVFDSFVIEVKYILCMPFKCADRSELLWIVFSPEAVGISKSRDSALCRKTRSGQDEYKRAITFKR